jgi:hypothetical protein
LVGRIATCPGLTTHTHTNRDSFLHSLRMYQYVVQLCINAASGAKIHELDDNAEDAASKSFVGYIVKGKPQFAG